MKVLKYLEDMFISKKKKNLENKAIQMCYYARAEKMDTAQIGTDCAFLSFQKSAKASQWGLNVSQAAFHTFINLFILLSKSE